MKNGFSTTDLALWIVFIAGQAVLCLSILKRGVLRRLRCFSIYVFASTAENLLHIALVLWGSYAAYYYTYHFTESILGILGFFTLVECGRRVLTSLTLPEEEKAFAWLLVALLAVASFSVLWPMRRIEDRFEVAAYLGIAVTFIFIASYARYVGLYYSRLLGGVSFTLGLLYLVDGSVRAIAYHYPIDFGLKFRALSPIANILAVIAWIIVVLRPWGEREVTEEELLAYSKIVDDIEANLRRFAAGGGK